MCIAKFDNIVIFIQYYCLQWINDLEKDKLYSAWPRSLHEVR